MCGIAGTFRLDAPATPDDVAAVHRMVEAQAHRGPDGSAVYQDGHAVLGHRRLSIIDLSPAGGQPIPNEDGTVRVTYNGEIYNFQELRQELVALGHRFRSRTDGEVLVHGYEAWGVAGLLPRLRGMFAFALYDSTRACLVLARDRLGIKPLYYALPENGRCLVFASGVKALTRSGLVPNERDREALVGFLCLGSIPAPRTAVKRVHCLMPGHYLTVDRRGAVSQRYWDLADNRGQGDGGDVTGELRRRLEDTVGRHLVSDVPLGVFLSGGVDSTGLVALASRMTRTPLHTLTVAFAEREFSEAPEARRTAESRGTEHHEILVTGADFVHELPSFFEALDQPTHDGVNTYFIAKAARKAGLTVVLSGLGGDEVFWGYPHYRWLTRRYGLIPWLPAIPDWLRKSAVAGASAVGRLRGREAWRRLRWLGPEMSAERLYLALRGFFAPEQVRRLLAIRDAEIDSSLQESFETVRPPSGRDDADPNTFNHFEMRRYLHDQLLRDADVLSMAHSIEVRVPYLDHTLVEYAASLPPRLKVDPQMNKPLLTRAIGDERVIELSRRRKRGFSFPMGQWMQQHSDELEEVAAGADCLDRRTVRALWRAFRSRRLHWSCAWALVVLGADRSRNRAA